MGQDHYGDAMILGLIDTWLDGIWCPFNPVYAEWPVRGLSDVGIIEFSGMIGGLGYCGDHQLCLLIFNFLSRGVCDKR